MGGRNLAAAILGAAATALAVVVTVARASVPAGVGERFDMRYEIYGFAGLHVLTNRTSLAIWPGRYAVAMDLQTRGVAGLFASLTSHSEVHGRVVDGSVYPEIFTGDVRRDGVEYRARVEYRPDGSVVAATSASEPEPRVMIADALTRGTVDQLTAYLMLERRLARAGSCALTVPVYDGRLRYDLYFHDAAAASPDRRSRTPARVCDMRRREIAGFAGDNGRTEGAAAGRIWYAGVVAGELMVPVRMQFATEFGEVTGRLAALHHNGAPMHPSE